MADPDVCYARLRNRSTVLGTFERMFFVLLRELRRGPGVLSWGNSWGAMVWRCPSSVKPHGGPKSFQMKDFGSILAGCCPQQHGVPVLCRLTNAGCDNPFTFTNLVKELPTGFVEVVVTCVYFSFILVFFLNVPWCPVSIHILSPGTICQSWLMTVLYLSITRFPLEYVFL